MSQLKINLDAIEREGTSATEGFCADGVRVGSLLVSSEGVRDSRGNSYVLSLSDLEVVPDAEGGFLGRGSSGSVRRAVHRRSNTMVALKEIKVTGKAHISEIRRELEALHAGNFATPYLVSFYGAFAHEGSVFIAMEAMDGSLHELPKPVPPPVLACITRLMLKGLTYLHRTRHLIHRDLKPGNVLFNSRTGDIKISDFGVSSNLESTKADAHSFVGTVTYMSPERLRGEYYSYGADIWSLGLVVAELAVGACPYAGMRDDSIEARFWALLQHLNSDGAALELPPEMDVDLADFISACVAKSPDKRPTCTELLRHSFITKYAVAAPEPPESRQCLATRPTVPTAEGLVSRLNSSSSTPEAAASFLVEGSSLKATMTSMSAFSSAVPSTNEQRPQEETDADAADRTVVAQWVHTVVAQEALQGARGCVREASLWKPYAADPKPAATSSGEVGGTAAIAPAPTLGGAKAVKGKGLQDDRSRDGQRSDSGSAPIACDCAGGGDLSAYEKVLRASTAEPSVNLDDELNKLLL
ncbi:hypothetical protein JKF63_00080 [Porcisia hertigi]|uniref:mitogen-activated protein kinase kinase n=1 Tax=Porcisia hertigi TaxID=2761500 RepID=A0A836HPC1_9TRYP|nr:hypothetical protein JKF63_00080 [Porcisia hertigi]